MLANVKKLLGLLVETQSGVELGKIIDINLEIENHVVNDYVVKRGFLKDKEYLIKPRQVVSIENNKMVVEDAAVGEEKENIKEKNSPKVLAGVSQLSEK